MSLTMATNLSIDLKLLEEAIKFGSFSTKKIRQSST